MQRRSLLKILGALTAGGLIPTLSAATPTATSINSAASLTAAMEEMFRCRMGPATAFFELTKGDGGVPYVELAEATGCFDDVLRIMPITFAAAIEDGDPKEAEAQLAQHFYNEFKDFAADKPLLYWRLQPIFESQPVTYYGDTFLSREQIEDGVKMYIPDGVEPDFETGAYRWVTKRVQLHKMRMRLAIPQISWKEATALVGHADGAPTARI